MADYKLNDQGQPVKVDLVEQETVLEVGALEQKVSELEGQLEAANSAVEEAQANVTRLEGELEEAKSDLEGVRAVVPADEEVADEESDESVAEDNEGEDSESPQF